MKHSIFIVLFLIGTNSFSQSKKKLLKEIKSYKKEIYFTATYISSVSTLKKEAFNYFKNYKLHTQDSFSITFTKIDDQNPKRNNQKQKHFVYIEINEIDSGFYIKLSDRTETYSTPFTSYDLNETRGSFKLNKTAFYRYLYHLFYGNPTIPESLQEKINNYNLRQTKDAEKLIAGRDY